MAYPVTKAVEVKAQENGKPRTLHLGIAQDDNGRTLFGVCARIIKPGGLIGDLSSMNYIVGGSFDPESVLERTRETGWFVFHAGSQLKVSALELEVALYKLKLINRVGVEVEHTPEGASRLVNREDNSTTKTPNLTNDQLKVLETLARIEGPALLRARGLGTFTLEVEDGTTLPSVRVLELDEGGFLNLSPAGDPGHPYLWAEVTDAGRAALQKTVEPTTQAPAQHLPRRGDAVERWLERVAQHDEYSTVFTHTVQDLLDDYRMRADAGVALDADLEG